MVQVIKDLRFRVQGLGCSLFLEGVVCGET